MKNKYNKLSKQKRSQRIRHKRTHRKKIYETIEESK